MSVPSMVHRSGDTLIVRSVVSGDTLFGSPEDTDFGDELSEITDDSNKDLPECKIKRNYSCARCDYFTQNPRHFLYHLRDVHKEKVRIYECPNCLYASKHFQKLLRHTKMVHGSTEGVDMPEYARAKGGKKRSSPPEEEDEEDDGEEEQEDSDECEVEAASVFKCSLCAFSARNQPQLAKHEREEHIKTKFFRCGKCTYVTHMKARFTKHVKYHSMPMIKCDLCDFRTPYKWNLDRHCKNHNGRGTFRCSACNFTADIKQSLTVHEMNHHVPPVGQAAGLGVGRRRNKVGASDSTAAEEAAQVAAAAAAARNESEQSAPPPPSPLADDFDDKKPLQSQKQQLKIPSAAKKSKTSEYNGGGTRAYASDFIHPDDIIHHANGNIYIKNKCKLCNYKSAWDGEMAKHEEKVHNILRPPPTNAKPKKPTRPVPNLIPIPPQTSVLKIIASPSPRAPKMSSSPPPPAEPIMSQKDINEICAKSSNSALKDFASLFNSEDVFKTPPREQPPQKMPDLLLPTNPKIRTRTSTELLKQKNASFFDKLKAKLTNTGGNLTCQHCGHESKCLTESTAHQKICGKERGGAAPAFAPVHSISSTRCQYCRQRCKSSSDLLNHLQTCLEALRSLESQPEEEEAHPDPEPHPMENRVFVWNNIEVPMDIEIDELPPYEFIEEKQEDNVSLDLSLRTQSPSCSENSEIQQPHNTITTTAASEKIPTHGNDISVAQHKRVFKCPHCSFWASTASRFHVHIVGHLNKKPFECSLCSYRSNWRWDITKHIKLKSVRDPAHETAKVLMTDETGRRNYTKYNKYLTEINVGGDHHNETSGGSGTRPRIHDSPSQVSPSKTELPKLTRAPNSSDFSPLLKNSLRPPPALKAADDSLFARVTAAEKKRPTADNNNKKTLWQCKKCNFRDASRDKLLLHVKGHYLQVEGAPAAVGAGDQGELLSGNPELDERHCRLKHHGDIRVVVGTKNGPEKVEVDEQLDESDHVDLPQTGTFKCKQCPFSNNDNEEFEQHLEGHTQKPPGTLCTKCQLCNFHVAHQDELHAHLKLHGIVEPEDYLAKRDGKSEAEVTKRYKCVTCPYVTNSKSQYSYHKQFHKPRGGQYTCPTCGYNVSKRHLLHQHLKVHGINAGLQQKQNGGDVIDLGEISDEIEEVTTLSLESSQQSFSDIPLVWVSKNAKFSKMYKCRYCPHVNLRKVNIQEHEKMHGVREKNPNASRLSEIEHRCPDCNYVCNNAGVLSSHSKVHQGLYGRIHCLVDPSKSDEDQVKELTHFLSLQASPSGDGGNLEDDEQMMETDYLEEEQADNSEGEVITLYFCDKCPARFLKENEFSIHLRFHGVRLFYKCEYCTYTARQKPHLLAHSNVHTDDYQERTKTLKTLYCTHPAHTQPMVYVSANQNGKAIWVVDETETNPLGKGYAVAEEMESQPPPPPPHPVVTVNVNVSNKVVVPLSGTDLFLQRNEANQKQLSQQFGGGNPDFIYPTCLKNGRMKEKRYKCLKCPSAFEKREQYKVHLSLHGSKQKYTCEICDYSVKYFANYAQHVKKHQMNAQAQAARNLGGEPEDELDAPAECPKQEEATTPKDPPPPPEDKRQLFWCPSCPYTNHRRDAVDNHQKRHISVSGTSSNYTCEHCDYSVPQVHFLRDHTKWHFAPNNKSIQPEAYMVCDKMKLTSRKVEDGTTVKMEEDVDDYDDNDSPESLIFEDRGGEATEENRFEPPLQLHLVDNEDEEKLFVNPETGEVVNNKKDFNKTTPAQASSTTDSSDISVEENLNNLDSQVASDN